MVIAAELWRSEGSDVQRRETARGRDARRLTGARVPPCRGAVPRALSKAANDREGKRLTLMENYFDSVGVILN